MGSHWSGFQPQNELVKLQWALLEASQFQVTEQELKAWLAQSGLDQTAQSDQGQDEDEPNNDVVP